MADLFYPLLKEGYIMYRDKFNKDPLLRSVLFESVDRAWWGDTPNPNTGLEQGEFYLSKEEYRKFGLRRSQSNQISRKLNELQKLKFIEKVTSKTGNKNATVYKFLPNDLLLTTWMMGNRTGNRPSINRKQNGHKYKDSNRENDNISILIEHMKSASSKTGLPFNTNDTGGYVTLLLSDQFYHEVLELIEKKSGKQYQRRELIVKIYKIAMTHSNNKFRRGKVSDFKTLYNGLPKMAGLLYSNNN